MSYRSFSQKNTTFGRYFNTKMKGTGNSLFPVPLCRFYPASHATFFSVPASGSFVALF
jgi:hypothetical protein